MRRLLPLLIAALLATTGPAFAQDHAATTRPAVTKMEDAPKLTVRGDAELMKPADQVRLSVGCVSEDAEAAVALRENNRVMRAVVQAIERAGLTEKEYETGRFQIRPTYSRRPRQPSPDWKPQIIGYQVTNTIIIRTTQLELTGKLIEVASGAGANSVDVAGFELSDDRIHRAEAIRTATRHAIDDATSLAQAAGLRLVRILAINLDNAQVRGPEMAFATQRAAVAADAAPPISPGDITIRAGVSIVYEIAPAANQ
ncbi:MAG: SIMPL domain-containing protein [Phycisphaerales bacterium]|nr:SIMPL domain-containing protein [Phycisphaerae bacterium]NNF41705.1 SIMPL domain-containing protein [Phycisphaerales bacterium]NNM25575.1 SIMPL domain-containing protein [Phycisphaerales bacterium]